MGSLPNLKIAQGGIAGTTGNDMPPNSFLARLTNNVLEELPETSSDLRLRFLPIAASFNIDSYLAYHRVPPISPIRQSSPREYFSNHFLSRLGVRRRRCVPCASRSQIIVASGMSDSAEISVSE